MNFNVEARTILYVRHGSHAYGLNVATSDEDFKGVCIKPKGFYFGFLNSFEQNEHMGSKSDGVDSVIYSLEKFAKLAVECNPNIIEVLHVDQSDVMRCNAFGLELRSWRDEFLSKRAKFTFAGYARAQLQRIEMHRSWLLNPPTRVPSREDFKLSDTFKVSDSEMGAFESAVTQGYVQANKACQTISGQLSLPKDVLTLFTREKQYRAEKTRYDQYMNWKKTRNPARAEMEAKYGYDVKHACHLIRLERMGREILMTGKVNVRRPDKEELLAIRRGERSYDSIIDEAKAIERECEELYVTSTLRKEPDRARLDKFIVSMTERYLSMHG